MQAYIEKNFLNFDPIFFFGNTCLNLSKERALSEAEIVIESLSRDTTKPFNLVEWCRRIKDNGYEIFNSDECIVYWANRENQTAKLLKGYHKALNNRVAAQGIVSTSTRIAGKISAVSGMKRQRECVVKPIERDNYKIDEVSVGTAIKNNAEELMKTYRNLNSKAKHVAGMSMNSIIDFSNFSETSQKQYYTDSEWNQIKEYYKLESPLINIRKVDCLDKLNKKLADLNLTETYAIARKSEVKHLNSSKEVIYKIYAHIVDLYRSHSEALKFKSNDPTELDSLMKIWGGILEPLFPDKGTVKCKWGESVAEHNEFKIDCRLIFFYNDKLVDLANMEAARYMTEKKTNDDHLKLAIESKDILDYIIQHSSSFDHKKYSVPMMQICNNHCDILKIYLGDDGLYCLDQYMDLTLPLTPGEFAKVSTEWFQKLLTFRNHVLSLQHLINNPITDKSYTSHFSRPEVPSNDINYGKWIRGSFYPPNTEESPLLIPNLLYGEPLVNSNKQQK